MKAKDKGTCSKIGGADGSTSVFIADRSKKLPLKIRIKNCIYRHKRVKAQRSIVANPHSLTETVRYAKDKYELIEIDSTDPKYIEQIECLKEGLILRHMPENGILPMDFHL